MTHLGAVAGVEVAVAAAFLRIRPTRRRRKSRPRPRAQPLLLPRLLLLLLEEAVVCWPRPRLQNPLLAEVFSTTKRR